MLQNKVMLSARKNYLMQFLMFYYEEKAENAVDYEDFDEQYEGPEIQAAGEEDYLLPKKEYIYSQAALATLKPTNSVFDDENYDEEEEEEEEAGKDHMAVDKTLEVQDISSSGQQEITVIPEESSPHDGVQLDSLDTENLDADSEDFEEEISNAMEEPPDSKGSTPLPVLCVEDGMVILRFSEIFGIHESLKKGEKRDRRYSIYKERYKSMDASDIVEDDEEAFLKGYGQVFQVHSHVNRYDKAVYHDGVLESGNDIMQGSVQNEEQRSCCLSEEPMDKDLSINLATGWQSPLFYPLDQQDWEDRICWDNSPAVSDHSVESCELSGPEFVDTFVNETEQGTQPQNHHLEFPAELDEKNHNYFFHSSPILVESFGAVDSSGPSVLPLLETRCHPQLLRLELLEAEKHIQVDGERENNAVEAFQNDAFKRFSKLTLQNRDIMEDAWLDNIIWESNKTSVKPKLILDLQDEQMLFEVLDNKDSEHLQHHAGAMIMTRSLMPRGSPELSGHGYESGWRFNIANDKFYMNRKISQQLQSNSTKRSAYGTRVHHSAPAIKLQTMKLRLSNKDLAYFHRPKALWYPHDNEVAVKEQKKLPTQGPTKVLVKSLGGKGSKLHVDAEETVSSVKAKASKKLDFKPSEMVKLFYLGKELEDHESLAAQNVQPNSLLHLVRTKLHLLPRAQRIPGENKSLRPPGAFKKKSDLSVKDGHVFLMEYCEERPLLLSNIGMGANLCTYYQKSSPNDQTGVTLRNKNNSLGNVVVLEPTDKSPFLGDINTGCSQSALVTNMYKAPIFPHKVASTDYLLVRSAKGKLSIRRIDRVAVVGQQEPLMEVFSPASKNLQAYIINRLLVYVYREFRAAEKRGAVPWIRADELSAQFPNASETILRKKLKECAVLRKDTNGHLFWFKKRDFIVPTEEDLKKFVLPENVCAYESMQAGLYRLKHLGITRLTLPTSVSTAMSQLPDEAIALAAASHIERELQITPWSLSSNFVACTNQDRENIERLEITGVGDPSGRGLGFSYVRAAPKGPVSNALAKKKAAARGSTTVTGTDADLRRLSMEAAREVLLKFNVPEEQIAKQTRWHRIAMIRKLSSEQAASGVKVDPTTISKYARGQRMSFLQLQQQTREKCQEIWERQVQSLSAVYGDEIESDSEANSDLDSFAGDLENLLDAEECEGDESNYESKNDKADGVKGIKMRRRPLHAQAEEAIEDEAAEAAELCRLLMDENEAAQKKKKKPKTIGFHTGLVPGSKSNFVYNAERMKQINKVHPNGSFVPIESSIRDSKEVETSFIKKKTFDKMKTTKKNGIPESSSTPVIAKVKILNEGFKIFKEKKSSREKFVCGACGQLGHMRTNKHCPRYREDPEAQIDNTDLEKSFGRSNSLDPSIKLQQKLQKKKSLSKTTPRVEDAEGEKSSLKAKALPVKFVCGSTDKISDKPVDGAGQSTERPTTSDVRPVSSDMETGSKLVGKISKIKLSNKAKPEDAQVDSRKPSIVIRPPMDSDRGQNEYHKPSIVIRPPANAEKGSVESPKPSIVIRPPAVKDRGKQHKKIVIRQPKEFVDLDQVSQDGSTGFEHPKIKTIAELSGVDMQMKPTTWHFSGESAKKKSREERRWWEEEEKRRHTERLREERSRRFYAEDNTGFAEEGVVELRRYEEAVRRERMEEEQQKAKKKKKKKKHEFSDDYLEDYRASRRMPERERSTKKRPMVELGRYAAEQASATKRRRGGEVGLANILEGITDQLRNSLEVSYLFLKPVSKKEAPDYLDIIETPMDLSTIRDKVRKIAYKDRQEFRHDVCQIAINAHLYNDGRNPGIPPLADQLLEICDYLLNEQDYNLSQAEEGIGY
ncbi:transcription initiation factor TFIID subunit 1 isoform X2 [Mercurialis annua]|uniref:transcription initiation factor TFIID subunit 1 isoform X2 n=1 Tax=Mercurialis annua TaxID=3986 RepID=UPI002160A39F|nr:transcription initiation factor TFIID subunit 1 isoform X2 [Mercurialis annua]